MKSIFEILTQLSGIPAVSGREMHKIEKQEILSLFPGAQIDEMGNILFVKKGSGDSCKKILIEAHRDEIGLCVKDILDAGFLSVGSCGGIDPSILPGTEFFVCGKKKLSCIATSTPPHLSGSNAKNDKFDFDRVFLDTGLLTKNNVRKYISIGDPVIFSCKPIQLCNGRISGHALDNKASAAAVLLLLDKLDDVKNDLYFLFSVGEETTSRGVRKVCRDINPDIAIVIDVGFGYVDGLDKSSCILMDGGPSVSYTDTLSRKMSDWVKDVAKKNDLSLQVIAEPGGTGTSATAIQLENGGIPTAVISIPLHNMHTPCEIVSENDIEKTAKLLFALIADENIPCSEVILHG